MKTRLIAISLFLIPMESFAIFCPGSFNNIDFGNTTQQVVNQCGAPATAVTYTQQQNVPQQWDYYVQQNPLNPITTKMSIVFNDNKAINITITQAATSNNVLCQQLLQSASNQQAIEAACDQSVQKTESVQTTTVCGSIISLGNSPDTIQAACGKPVFVTQSQPQNPAPPTQIIEYKYNSPPPNVLIFENGILKDRR